MPAASAPISIRPYRPSDASACARVHRAAMNTKPWDERWPLRRSLQKVRSMGRHQKGFVALADRRVVGQVWATEYLGPRGPILFITNLQVDPSFHGNGAGTALLAAVEAHARAKRIRALELLTNRRVPAYRFYRSRGWATSPYQTTLRKRL